MSYTKGKWYWRKNLDNGELLICSIVERNGQASSESIIANLECDNFGDILDDELNANAQVIAASPDLLAACKDARHTFAELLEEGRLVQSGEKDIMPVVWSIIVDMIEAIEKATI